MRAIVHIAAALAASAAAAGAASAQTTIIEREEPTVVVRERPAVIERREVERVPAPVGGCESKTVTRTDDDGETTTVRRERCD